MTQVTSGANERFPSGQRTLLAFSEVCRAAGGRRSSFLERVELINLSKVYPYLESSGQSEPHPVELRPVISG